MQDTITDAEKAEKKRIARLLARTLFNQNWSEQNPEGSAEDRKAAYKEVQADQVKAARKLQRVLENRGVVMSLTAEAAAKGDDA